VVAAGQALVSIFALVATTTGERRTWRQATRSTAHSAGIRRRGEPAAAK